MIKKLFTFIVFTNIWVSLGATAFAAFTYAFYAVPFNFYYLLFVFSATLTVYNFHRLLRFFNEQKVNHLSERHRWIMAHSKTLQRITFFALGLLIWASIHLSLIRLIQLLFPVAGIIILYVLPGNRFFKGLRHIPFIKLVLIGFSWGYVAVAMPFRLQDTDIPMYFFTAQTVLIMAITLPFDIRDIRVDIAENVSGIATVFGEQGAKLTAYLLVLSAGILVWNNRIFVSLEGWQAYLAGLVACLPVIYFSSPRKPELYFSGLVESTLFLPLLFWYLLIK